MTNTFGPVVDPETRKVKVSDLVGAQEIADLLGVVRTQVYKWATRFEGTDHPFPKAVTHLNMGQVWNWPDVEAWARKTGRYPVKPETT